MFRTKSTGLISITGWLGNRISTYHFQDERFECIQSLTQRNLLAVPTSNCSRYPDETTCPMKSKRIILFLLSDFVRVNGRFLVPRENRLCTRERSILGSKREPSRLASLQLLVGPKRTILVIKMELGRKERWLAVELFLFFFSLDAAAIAEAPAGLRIAEPSFVNPNQGHGRHG